MSLYDKYGGFAGIHGLVQAFYVKVLESDLLAPYFEGIEMSRLIGHQVRFFCKVLGGPDNYTGRSLAAAHRDLQISTPVFAEVARLLQETCQEAGMEPADIETVMATVGTTSHYIVTA
jgi:hemoglobin